MAAAQVTAAAVRGGPGLDAPEARARSELLRDGQLVTARSVAARVLSNRQHQQAVRRKAQSLPDVDTVGPVAARWVAGYVAREGVGPFWTEITRHVLGRPGHAVGHRLVEALITAGYLTAGEAARSTRPGPAWDGRLPESDPGAGGVGGSAASRTRGTGDRAP